MIEDVVEPCGPYRLRLMVRSGRWQAPLEGGRRAEAWQRPDGNVVIRASDADGVAKARFMLGLDDDTEPFHRLFGRDTLIGPAARALVGYRPLRLATVADELREGVVQDSLADVQLIATLLGLIFVIWTAVPAIGALFLGSWLRREMAPTELSA
mgnify:CR=1 FL=1